MDAQAPPPHTWLDMSLYLDLPPDDAVSSPVLAALRAVLRAAQPPMLTPAVWQAAVHGAVNRHAGR